MTSFVNGPVQGYGKPLFLFRFASFCPLQLYLDCMYHWMKDSPSAIGGVILGPKWDNTDTFPYQMSVDFDSRKCTKIWSEKSQLELDLKNLFLIITARGLSKSRLSHC